MAHTSFKDTGTDHRQHAPARLAAGPASAVLVERIVVAAAHAEYEFRAYSPTNPTALSIGDIQLSDERVWAGHHATASTAIALSIRTCLADIAIRRFSCSTHSPTVYRFPVSVIIYITHHLDIWDRVMLARTNRAFRNALLSEPTLWNRIDVPLPLGFSAEPNWRCAKILLSRAYPTSGHLTPPIHIRSRQCLEPRPEAAHMHDTLDELICIASTLDLEFLLFRPSFGEEPRWSQQEAIMWSLMCQEAPLLTRLSLTAPDLLPADSPLALLPMEFLGCKAGCLRSLFLQHVRLQGHIRYPALGGLREFNYNPGTFSGSIESSTLQFALESMPQLQYLGLANVGFVVDATNTTARHDRLLEVTMECIWDGLDNLIQFFKQIPKIRCHNSPGKSTLYDVWPTGDIGLSMQRSHVVVRPATIDPAYTFGVWAITEWAPDTGIIILSIDIPSAHVTRIVSLSMRDEEWDTARHLPPLPQLQTVSIVISTCFSQCPSLEETCWGISSSRDEIPQWQTSLGNLRQVCLYSTQYARSKDSTLVSDMNSWLLACGWKCCRDNGCVIFLSEITDFVRSLQLADRRRLPRLVLCGFDSFADIEPGVELCELLKLVDEVEGGDDSLLDELLWSGASMSEPLTDTRLASEFRRIFDGMTLPALYLPHLDLLNS